MSPAKEDIITPRTRDLSPAPGFNSEILSCDEPALKFDRPVSGGGLRSVVVVMLLLGDKRQKRARFESI